MENFIAFKNSASDGVILLGNIQQVSQITNGIKKEISQELNLNLQEIDLSMYSINSLIDTMSKERERIFMLDKPYEERVYTLVLIDQSLLTERVAILFAEKRPLKLIPIVHIKDLLPVHKQVLNTIFWNFNNFIINDMSESSKQILLTYKPMFKDIFALSSKI